MSPLSVAVDIFLTWVGFSVVLAILICGAILLASLKRKPSIQGSNLVDNTIVIEPRHLVIGAYSSLIATLVFQAFI